MQSLFFFLLALALLIVVHEYGHFWMARRCGVKVLKFSVGFGSPIWRKQAKDGTEYVVAALPLGGFVKMLDEREGDVPAEQIEQTFNRQPLKSRIAIVAAGPIANILFAILAYWLIFVMGIPGIRSIVGNVATDSPAQYAQIVVGDEITSVNGRHTPTWMSVQKALLLIANDGGIAEITISKEFAEEQHRKIAVPKRDIDSQTSLIQQLGITPIQPKLKPIVGSIIGGGAAQKAGMEIGDELISADGVLIDNWAEWVALIQASPQKTLNINVMRDGIVKAIKVTPIKTVENHGQIGAGVDASQTKIPDEMLTELRYDPAQAVLQATIETWQFTAATLKSLVGMVTGSVSSKNLGGPISIAQIAGASAEHGFISFVSFLAMISISLGILNLLPIPVLDGGHLAMYMIEWVRGKPLSEQSQLQGQKLGIILLLMLMFFAFFNDLSRLFG